MALNPKYSLNGNNAKAISAEHLELNLKNKRVNKKYDTGRNRIKTGRRKYQRTEEDG